MYYISIIQKVPDLGGGDDIPLSNFKNAKAILIVNTASTDGYSESQLMQLAKLHNTYNNNGKGLEVLLFPCLQFGDREYHDADKISSVYRRYARKMDTTSGSAPSRVSMQCTAAVFRLWFPRRGRPRRRLRTRRADLRANSRPSSSVFWPG